MNLPELADMFPKGDAVAELGFRPCLVCGAQVTTSLMGVHFFWHMDLGK